MMPRFRFIVFLSILFAFAIFSGCSRHVKVRGTVTFSDDNTPLTVGTVILQNETYSAKGILDSTGHFIVSSVKRGDGIPPGVYQVSITGAMKTPEDETKTGESAGAIEAAMTATASPMPIPLIDTKYMTQKTSGITFDTSRQSVLNIKVDRFKAK